MRSLAPWRREKSQVPGVGKKTVSQNLLRGFGFAAVSLVLAAPVLAQKSKDTLRFPLPEALSTLDRYLNPGSFANVWEPSVHDNLLGYDPKTAKFMPLLAKAWSQPNPTTLEFELRDDVKFHDGQPFDADDVVYTINWIIDPKVQMRYKTQWNWIKSVEKLGSHKVRIIANSPVPDALTWMSFGTPIYPEHYHAALADKNDFGERPVGTGPYRITKVDKNLGIFAEKYNDFIKTPSKPAASIGKVIAEPIPDAGTMIAALLAGKSDIAIDIPIEQALDLRNSGKFDVTLSPPPLGLTYLQFPTAAWAASKPLADVRVRRAIMMAVDRKLLMTSQFGALAEGLQPVEGLCSKEQQGCGYTKLVPEFDPAGAKKLLADAGYPNGFEVTISVYPVNTPQATALSGMLRNVGIHASVRTHSSAQRVKLVREGKVEIGYYGWSGGSMFEVGPQIVRHFQSAEYDDPEFSKLADPTFSVVDDAERRKVVAKAFDYFHDQAYAFPMVPLYRVYTHSKEVKLLSPSDVRTAQTTPHEFGWK